MDEIDAVIQECRKARSLKARPEPVTRTKGRKAALRYLDSLVKIKKH